MVALDIVDVKGGKSELHWAAYLVNCEAVPLLCNGVHSAQ